MNPCVIYARVSTKEQQEEGYSIDTQLKALHTFCKAEKLTVVAEFVAAESASKPGRETFAQMIAFLAANPGVRSVVVMRLDRLSRNWADSAVLEQMGIRVRCVEGDVSDSPEGLFAADVLKSQAVYFSRDLSRKVGKGMTEKVAQGGWPHKAPAGYRNDKDARTLVIDPRTAPLIVHAFTRYASGLVSISKLADELYEMGLRTPKGRKYGVSGIDHLLKSPIYCGLMRWKGELYQGAHEPLISRTLFDTVQEAFGRNRRKNNAQKRSYALRDFLWCSECGAKITAGAAKGHVYYRCTHGKGDCSQRAYVREEALNAEITEVLSRVAIGPDLIAALVEEARIREAGDTSALDAERAALQTALDTNARRSSTLLNTLLDGIIDQDAYGAKNAELVKERSTLLLRLEQLSEVPKGLTSQVEALATRASTAVIDFSVADDATKRDILAGLLCYLKVEDGRIASYQWKDPIGVLEMDSSGAFCTQWWAM